MRKLIDDLFMRAFDNEALRHRDDQARVAVADLIRYGDRLAMSTDSYVVDPLIFAGGDIGKLAVCGTVNDLAVSGAIALYLSCGLIIEEGLPVRTLERIIESMAQSARQARVQIVTGDTKVVNRGACDKLFINTTGIGVIHERHRLGIEAIRPGDAVLVNGALGDHGAAILQARGEMKLECGIESDCAPLQDLIQTLLKAAPNTRFIRDATRGGIASVLNEIAEGTETEMEIFEEKIPIRSEVKAFCEILGLDPLYLANEGKIVCIVPAAQTQAALVAMQGHEFGKSASEIGRIQQTGKSSRVTMHTAFGGRRIVDDMVGEQLPRIC